MFHFYKILKGFSSASLAPKLQRKVGIGDDGATSLLYSAVDNSRSLYVICHCARYSEKLSDPVDAVNQPLLLQSVSDGLCYEVGEFVPVDKDVIGLH
jgi:hypothetical protein